MAVPAVNPLEAVRPSFKFLEIARKIYRNYVIRAVLQSLVTVWAVITFTFFLVRLMPGNPVQIYIEFLIQRENISYQEAAAHAAAQFRFDFNATPLQQYLDYVGQLARGDLGESITSTGTKVIDQILRFLPWTIFSVVWGCSSADRKSVV